MAGTGARVLGGTAVGAGGGVARGITADVVGCTVSDTGREMAD